MEIFAVFFAIFMIAMAIGATVIMTWAVGIVGGLALAATLILIYYAFTYESPGMSGPMKRDELNAFQAALADDDDAARPPRTDRWEDRPRNGFRNRGYRKHIARKARKSRV